MNIHLDRQSTVPLAKQIYQAVVDRIESGLLDKSGKLPSVRVLSKTLKVSLVTVVKAYSFLERDFFIVKIQGKGTYVREKKSVAEENLAGSNPLDWQLSLSDYLPRAQFWKQNISLRTPSQVWLSGTTLHSTLFPENKIQQKLFSYIFKNASDSFSYGPAQGDGQFRSSLAEYLKWQGILVDKNDLIVTNGSQQAINLIARTFVGPGDLVMMEVPIYAAAIDIFRWQGANIVSVPMDQNGMRTDFLLKLCEIKPPKLIYTIPTYSNPTGAILSLQRRRDLIDIARSFNCIIVEDDPWREITFEKNRVLPLKNLDNDGHVIYVKGFSKFLLPSCRIGAIAASGTIKSRLIAAKATDDLGSSALMQKALLPFLQIDFMAKYLKELNSALVKRRDFVLELLLKSMPSGVSWTIPKGGPNIWITLPAWLNAEQVAIEAQNHNLAFLLGATCYPSEPQWNQIRISYSSLEEQTLKNAIGTLGSIVSKVMELKDYSTFEPII